MKHVGGVQLPNVKNQRTQLNSANVRHYKNQVNNPIESMYRYLAILLEHRFFLEHNNNVYILIACLDVRLNIVGKTENENTTLLKKKSTVRWQLGPCSSLNSIYEDTIAEYHFPALYTERCCLNPGRHTLLCHSKPAAQGWKDEYILIDGHRYCDNFIGYESFQKIFVTGVVLKNLIILTPIFYLIVVITRLYYSMLLQ